MLRLTRPMDTVEVVCLGDDRVTPRFKLTADALDTARKGFLWVRRSDCDVAEGAIVATVRGLSHRETAQCATDEERYIDCTLKGVVMIAGEGIPSKQTAPGKLEVDIEAALDLLPYHCRAQLGVVIMRGSMGVLADPFVVSASASSSGATSSTPTSPA